MSRTTGTALLVGFGGLRILSKDWLPQGPTLEANLMWGYVDSATEGWKEMMDIRSKLIKKLTLTPDVTGVSDLFDQETYDEMKVSHTGFPPIIWSLKLPQPLHEWEQAFRKAIPTQDVNEYQIVYDGRVITYAQQVDLSLPFSPFSFVDVRTRILEILQAEFQPEVTPPNVAEGFLIAPSQYETKFASFPVLFLPSIDNLTVKDTLARVYSFVNSDLCVFYETCRVRGEVQKTKFSIETSQHAALKQLHDFLSSSWYDFRKRRRILNAIHRSVIDVLEMVSQYFELNASMKDGQSAIRDLMDSHIQFKNLMKQLGWLEYADEPTLEMENVTHIAEHISSEVQTFISTASNYRSALIGAVVGALATLATSYFLHIV